ncbi:MAG: hypothetical protein RMY28_038225 [Nostoc sp. ChiSLP01]|nr:hypothetical protein [Nostoc sp. CmiSLP01]MDZ8282350.1 hypothetical protein [Nostoc sp. ChiSLP01]
MTNQHVFVELTPSGVTNQHVFVELTPSGVTRDKLSPNSLL